MKDRQRRLYRLMVETAEKATTDLTTQDRHVRILKLLLEATELDQTAEEAERELREDGVDVDAFLKRVREEIDERGHCQRCWAHPATARSCTCVDNSE